MGAASRDLDPSDPRGWRLGGGVTYSAMALARLGVRVGALIGLDEEAAGAPELDVLRRAGVRLVAAPLACGPVFDNQETPQGRRQVCHSLSDRLSPRLLPPAWRAPAAVILNPVAGELAPAWARVFAPATLVALGWQGLLRRLVAGRPVEPLPIRPLALIARADLATVSVEDAVAGGAALGRLMPRDGQQLVVTSDRGMSLHMSRERAGWRVRRVPVRPAVVVRDPTGAGDVFLAAWTAGVWAARAAGAADEAWRPLALAAAAAGAKVETATLADMPDLRQLCERLMPRDVIPPA